jgi:hypothetical protein
LTIDFVTISRGEEKVLIDYVPETSVERVEIDQLIEYYKYGHIAAESNSNDYITLQKAGGAVASRYDAMHQKQPAQRLSWRNK